MRLKLALVLLMLVAPATAQTVTPTEVLDAAVTEVIRPAMTDFSAEAGVLDAAMTTLCAEPSETNLAAASQQFGLAAAAYGRIEFLRLGPLLEDNRADRLLFWPDRRGIGLRQVQAILAEQDETATTVAALRDKSVAVQGLGALEFVLFGTGYEQLSGADGAFRCRYGSAIAGNIKLVADELAAAWAADDGIAGHLMHPQAENSDYRTETEALEALVGQISHGLEGVRDTRINPFVASADSEAKPKQALFWRSGLTVPMLKANFDGLRQLMAVSRVASAVGEKDQGLANSIDFEFRNAERALGLVTLPVEQAVADEKQAQALRYLVIVTQSLQAMVGEQLSTALALSVGFSSLDGD